jgi:hypothetical protein
MLGKILIKNIHAGILLGRAAPLGTTSVSVAVRGAGNLRLPRAMQ